MKKKELIDRILTENNGVLRMADAEENDISKQYFLEYVKRNGLERVSRGVYLALDAWADEMYLFQLKYPKAIFSHETALYLLGLSDYEAYPFSITVKSGYHTKTLDEQGVNCYFIKKELYELGCINVNSPAGHTVKVYNAERTICDIIRSRNNIEASILPSTIKTYLLKKDRNIPLLLRYSKEFRVEKILKRYLEVML